MEDTTIPVGSANSVKPLPRRTSEARGRQPRAVAGGGVPKTGSSQTPNAHGARKNGSRMRNIWNGWIPTSLAATVTPWGHVAPIAYGNTRDEKRAACSAGAVTPGPTR